MNRVGERMSRRGRAPQDILLQRTRAAPGRRYRACERPTDELIGVGMAPFFYLPHTLFVAERGLEHFELSMRTQYELTKRFTAESSVRPYIARDPERAMVFLQRWAADANPHVRRLVSEGTRCRLPSAQRVAWLDQHPGSHCWNC